MWDRFTPQILAIAKIQKHALLVVFFVLKGPVQDIYLGITSQPPSKEDKIQSGHLCDQQEDSLKISFLSPVPNLWHNENQKTQTLSEAFSHPPRVKM